MIEKSVKVFFYGSYINVNVLKEVNINLKTWEVAKLSGYDIKIEPRANLILSDQYCVYGIITQITHNELSRLYTHAKDILGETYLPEAVLVETKDNKLLPALCYIAPEMLAKPASNDYIDRIVNPSKEYGFPHWYISRLESFRTLF